MPSILLEDTSLELVGNKTNGNAKILTLHRNVNQKTLYMDHQLGNYLFLTNGWKLFDASGGAAVACLGYNNKRVEEAVIRQLRRVIYCPSRSFGTAIGDEFAEELIDSTGGRMTRAYVCASGSEAMEAAMKLARQYWVIRGEHKRTKFIARETSYHGATLGALSMSGHVTRRSHYECLLLPNVTHVSACNQYRGLREGETGEAYVSRLAQELWDEFEKVGGDEVVAFVAEPTVGAALGCAPAAPGYFKAMKRVCDHFGALLILDEVMCGMGRCGTLHAWEQEDVVPDIQTIGKGLGGGHTVAGMLASKHVAETIEGGGGFAHGHTYQGEPVQCAAALEIMKIIREDNLIDNICKMGNYLDSLLRKQLGNHPNVGDIRGKGLFLGIEFVKDKKTKEPFDPSFQIAEKLHWKALEPPYSIYFYPGTGSADGIRGDHIIISPAYNITEKDVEHIVNKIEKVIKNFFTNLQNSSKPAS